MTTPTSAAVVADRLVSALNSAGVDARPAGDGDRVDGVPAAVVASPGSTADTAAALRVAAEHSSAVVARGTATKLTWGAPPERADLLLDTTAMSAVVDHAAGDLVVQVQAGLRLDALQDVLARAGQRLALDPSLAGPANGRGTVGGTIATAASGPLRLSHGAVRDLLIGMTFVRADGSIAKAGGRVVKNVAGYDLAKLFAGSFGTLGVITEAVFRLHPAPPVSRWVVADSLDLPTLDRALQATVQSQLVPAAVEIDRSSDGMGSIAVLIEGVEDGVAGRVDRVLDLVPGGTVQERAPDWWGRLPGGPGTAVLKLTAEIAAVPRLLAAIDDCGVVASVRGSAGVGVLYAAPQDDAAAAVRALRSRSGEWSGDVVVVDGPPGLKAAVDVWGPVRGLNLMRRIKEQFDPERRLAPGRFVGGI